MHTVKAVAKLQVDLVGWEVRSGGAVRVPGTAVTALHARAVGILPVLWDLLPARHGDASGVSGQQN